VIRVFKLCRAWQVQISVDGIDFNFNLRNNQAIALGDFTPDCIGAVPLGSIGTIAKLKREGINLYITPHGAATLILGGQAIIGRKEIPRNLNNFTLEFAGQMIQVTVQR